MRKIHWNDKIYKYLVGRRGGIKIVLPDGKIVITDTSKVVGLSWTNIERICWKNRMKSYPVKPSQIKRFIENYLKEEGNN